MTPSYPKSEVTRTRILEAAFQLFLEQGYAATSVRQIARQAEMTVGGIYNHFASKDEIWRAVVEVKHPYHQILPMIEQAQGETIDEILRDAAHRMIAGLGDRPDLLKLMFIELVEFNGQDVTDLFQMAAPRMLVFASRALQKRGKLRDIPIPVMVRAFLGIFVWYYMTEMMVGKDLQAAFGPQTVDQYIDIYLYGILDSATEAAHA
jgi:AcrR family transcriptional regulator